MLYAATEGGCLVGRTTGLGFSRCAAWRASNLASAAVRRPLLICLSCRSSSEISCRCSLPLVFGDPIITPCLRQACAFHNNDPPGGSVSQKCHSPPLRAPSVHKRTPACRIRLPSRGLQHGRGATLAGDARGAAVQAVRIPRLSRQA